MSKNALIVKRINMQRMRNTKKYNIKNHQLYLERKLS